MAEIFLIGFITLLAFLGLAVIAFGFGIGLHLLAGLLLRSIDDEVNDKDVCSVKNDSISAVFREAGLVSNRRLSEDDES